MSDTWPPALFVVFAEPSAEREAEFHHWYDRVHGPDAIDNGSFRALRRYRAAGPGWVQARYLALWEGDYRREPDAWAYIRPRAQQLRAAGRVGDVASVVFALMLFHDPTPWPEGATEPGWRPAPASLVTVQNDWRHPDPGRSAAEWWKQSGLDDTPSFVRASLYTSDPEGAGGGYHLAIFEVAAPVTAAIGEWASLGAAGMSPTPPYRTIFASGGGESEPDPHAAPPASAGRTAPPPATSWVMGWEHVSSLGERPGGG